jgi:hypothetical protein
VPGGQLHHQAQVPAPLLVGRAARPDHPGVAGGDVPGGQLYHLVMATLAKRKRTKASIMVFSFISKRSEQLP